MPDEGLSAVGQLDLLLGQAEELARRLGQAEQDVRRVEAFAASSFMLNLVLLRDMLASGQLPKARAVHLLSSSIGYLRRLYRLDALDDRESDTIDTEALVASLTAAERHKGAEELLREVLVAVGDR